VFAPESLTDHVTQNAVRVTPLDPMGVLARDLPSRGCQAHVVSLSPTTVNTCSQREVAARGAGPVLGRSG
jgi:hypothetical protein